MTDERWRALMKDDFLELTQDEIKEGWHFCYEFDGLLVGPGMMETEFCQCVSQISTCLSTFKTQEEKP